MTRSLSTTSIHKSGAPRVFSIREKLEVFGGSAIHWNDNRAVSDWLMPADIRLATRDRRWTSSASMAVNVRGTPAARSSARVHKAINPTWSEDLTTNKVSCMSSIVCRRPSAFVPLSPISRSLGRELAVQRQLIRLTSHEPKAKLEPMVSLTARPKLADIEPGNRQLFRRPCAAIGDQRRCGSRYRYSGPRYRNSCEPLP